jgi:hypothetical protein
MEFISLCSFQDLSSLYFLDGYPPDAALATPRDGPPLSRKGIDSSRITLAQSRTPQKLSSRAAAEASAAVDNIPTE